MKENSLTHVETTYLHTVKSGNLVTFLVQNIFFLRKSLRTHAIFLVLKVV